MSQEHAPSHEPEKLDPIVEVERIKAKGRALIELFDKAVALTRDFDSEVNAFIETNNLEYQDPETWPEEYRELGLMWVGIPDATEITGLIYEFGEDGS